MCKDKEELLDLDVIDLTPSSTTDNIDNIFSKDSTNTWQPADDETLEINLPDVNDKSAGEYDIMSVTFKTTDNIGPVTVKILDQHGAEVFWVSQESH